MTFFKVFKMLPCFSQPFFLVQHSLWPDISIKILISLSNVLFALPLVTNLRIKDTLIQHTTEPKIHCLSLACPAVSASVQWHTRLNRASECFFCRSVIGRQWIPWEPLFCWRQRGHLLFTLRLCTICLPVSVRRPSPTAVSDALGNFSGLAWWVKVVIACTPCLTVVCFYLSQKLHNVVTGGLQMYCIFSRMCVTAVAMQLLLPVGTWWGVSLLNDGRNSLFYSQTIQRSVTSDVLGFRPLSWLWERVL